MDSKTFETSHVPKKKNAYLVQGVSRKLHGLGSGKKTALTLHSNVVPLLLDLRQEQGREAHHPKTAGTAAVLKKMKIGWSVGCVQSFLFRSSKPVRKPEDVRYR